MTLHKIIPEFPSISLLAIYMYLNVLAGYGLGIAPLLIPVKGQCLQFNDTVW